MSESKEWFGGRAVDDAEARAERSDLRRIVGILLVIGIAVGVLVGATGCASSPASTEPERASVPLYVLEKGRTSIRLMPGPCVEPWVKEFVSIAKPEFADRFRAIASTWAMRDGTLKDFAGCWIEFSAEEVGYEAFGLIFEDGERHLVPKAEFIGGSGV